MMAKTTYIINANNIYIDLLNNVQEFQKEAEIIDDLKCYLINFNNLDEYYYPGVDINEISSGYEIIYDDRDLLIEVKEGMIVNYENR